MDTCCFDFSLNHSFTDKNRFVKGNVAVELEHIAICVNEKESVQSVKREEFHEFLRNSTFTFAKNIYRDKGKTFHSLAEILSSFR